MEMTSDHQFVIAKKREGAPATIPAEIHPEVLTSTNKDIWTLLLGLRLINALLVRTFFQPDEYFQALEPAWQMAFGPESGAWITWEWQYQLRSSLHPALFAAAYYTVDKVLELVACFPQFRAMILAVLPNVVQAVFAAAGDYYTWKLSEKIYGVGSNTTTTALLMTVLSPWQWFCSTRTFSNSLETTLTIAALYYWPWEMLSPVASGPEDATSKNSTNSKSNASSVSQTSTSVTNLRIALLLAGTASILRPTNLLIWFTLLMPIVTSFFTTNQATSRISFLTLLRESILCGGSILALSAASDYYYFGTWTFPPYQWLHFNITQNLAIFYGANDWHYYLSQGLPQLLTTYLPFTLVALWKTSTQPNGSIRFTLLTTILTTLATLSLISHKEVRFIYPLLPILHVLTAPTITTFFRPPPPTTLSQTRKFLASLLLFTNLLIAGYTTLFHQTSVISILPHLRQTYESHYLSPTGTFLPLLSTTPYPIAAFLMPCHSTPWRSQLYHANLTAWALTCEPPVHLDPNSAERKTYRDEADRFYVDMDGFLRKEVGKEGREWPRWIVGFESVEGALRKAWAEKGAGKGEKYEVVETWRGWNSHWIDDSRRKGDVIVWELVGREYGVDRSSIPIPVEEEEDDGQGMWI